LDTCISVLTQRYVNYEHIIIDGASTDNTVSIARSCNNPKMKIFIGPDRGIYDAMNKGLVLAKGDVVGFLNSDDVFFSDCVLSQIALAFVDDEIQCCYANLRYVHDMKSVCADRIWTSGKPNLSSIGIGWIPAHPTFYIRKKLVSKFGMFREDMRLAADHEFMSRYLIRLRSGTKYCPRQWVKMRLGGATNRSWMNIVRQNIEIIQGLSRLKISISLLYPIWKLLSRLRQKQSQQ
jgi:glycosyltransferase involved in cell wall biosynthesis